MATALCQDRSRHARAERARQLSRRDVCLRRHAGRVQRDVAFADGTSLTVGADGAAAFGPSAGTAPAAASPLAASPGAARGSRTARVVLLAVGSLLAIRRLLAEESELPFGLSGRCTMDGMSGWFTSRWVVLACGDFTAAPVSYVHLERRTTANGLEPAPANWGGTLPGSADIGVFSAARTFAALHYFHCQPSAESGTPAQATSRSVERMP